MSRGNGQATNTESRPVTVRSPTTVSPSRSRIVADACVQSCASVCDFQLSRGAATATRSVSVRYSAVIDAVTAERPVTDVAFDGGNGSSLDGAGGHTRDDLAVEEQEHDQRRNRDEQDVHEQQVP